MKETAHYPIDPRPPVGTAVVRPDGGYGIVSDHPTGYPPNDHPVMVAYRTGAKVWVRGADGVPCGWWDTAGLRRMSPWRWGWQCFRWQRAIQRRWTPDDHASRLHAHDELEATNA